MSQTDLLIYATGGAISTSTLPKVLAAGLFGYSLNDEKGIFKPVAGYVREIEQMPNFSPPSIELFVAQYIASNIARNNGAS